MSAGFSLDPKDKCRIGTSETQDVHSVRSFVFLGRWVEQKVYYRGILCVERKGRVLLFRFGEFGGVECNE